MLRLFKMSDLVKKIKQNELISEKYEGIFDLLCLLFLVIYLAHICGCAWHYVALTEIKLGYNVEFISFIKNINFIIN